MSYCAGRVKYLDGPDWLYIKAAPIIVTLCLSVGKVSGEA